MIKCRILVCSDCDMSSRCSAFLFFLSTYFAAGRNCQSVIFMKIVIVLDLRGNTIPFHMLLFCLLVNWHIEFIRQKYKRNKCKRHNNNKTKKCCLGQRSCMRFYVNKATYSSDVRWNKRRKEIVLICL